MSTLQELIAQREQVTGQIESLRAAQKAEAVAAVRAIMSEHGLTADDVVPRPAGRKVPPKYRDADGNTWTGRGRMPVWLASAIAAGVPLASFLIPAQ